MRMTTPPPAEVRRIAVLGAGTMGHGIAQVAAMAGYRVYLRDMESAGIDAAMSRIRGNLDAGVARAKVAPEARDAALARLSATTDLAEAVADAELVIEAVPEVLEVKTALFAEVVAGAKPGVILATNTSSLSVGRIARSLPSPGRVVGMHFFNPVHIMKLIEIVTHDALEAEVLGAVRAVVEAMGKTAITVRDSPGFASSRLGIALGLEAMRMLEAKVASAADIDAAMTLGYGHPMGPLELTDLVGLDVRLKIADYLVEEIGPAFRAPPILREKVAEGALGKKAGRGFYRWEDGRKRDA